MPHPLWVYCALVHSSSHTLPTPLLVCGLFYYSFLLLDHAICTHTHTHAHTHTHTCPHYTPHTTLCHITFTPQDLTILHTTIHRMVWDLYTHCPTHTHIYAPRAIAPHTHTLYSSPCVVVDGRYSHCTLPSHLYMDLPSFVPRFLCPTHQCPRHMFLDYRFTHIWLVGLPHTFPHPPPPHKLPWYSICIPLPYLVPWLGVTFADGLVLRVCPPHLPFIRLLLFFFSLMQPHCPDISWVDVLDFWNSCYTHVWVYCPFMCQTQPAAQLTVQLPLLLD